MAQAIPWKRILAESALIVASILLAFAIDAGWDERQEREEEAAARDQLRTEFRATLEQLDEILERHERNLEVLSSVFGVAEEPIEISADSVTIEVTRAMTEVMTLDPPTSTLRVLIGGGRFTLIDDLELRDALMTWQQRLEDSDEEAEKMLDTLDRSVNLLHGLGALESSGAQTWTHRTEGAAARILGSAELRAHAAVLSFWRHGYSQELRRLRESTVTVLGLLGEG